MTTKQKATKKGATTTWTLTECAVKYLESLKVARKSEATVSAYASDLDLAVAVLGGETPISAIGLDQIHAFNQSEPVLKTKSGRDKALPTIERSRRVLRLALVFAEQQGAIESAPIPPKRATTTSEPVAETPAPAPAKPKRAKKLPLHQREAIGNDDARIHPAADADDPAQIAYASTGEPVAE